MKNTGGMGLRGAHPLSAMVRQKMSSEPIWAFRSRNEKWICPFCLSAVAKRPGRNLEDSIAQHLDNCRSWAGGRGKLQAVQAVSERLHFEDMCAAAETDPAWRVYDADGAWICLACLEKTPLVRLQGGQLNNFVFQAMARHLTGCPAYRQGRLHPANEVEAARVRLAQAGALAQHVAQQLAHPVWRYVDAAGSWVCPCCLAALPGIRIASPGDLAAAPQAISRHLVGGCPGYDLRRPVLQPETAVRQAAGREALAFPTDCPAQPVTSTSRIGLSTATGPPPVATPLGSPQSGSTPQRSPAQTGTSRGVPELPTIATPVLPMPTVPPPPEAGPPAEADPGQERGLTWMDDVDSSSPEVKTPAASERTDMLHARKLQATFLQNLPTLAGYRFATRFEPCNDITGDFFVFIEQADGGIGFAIGDVSGHGVQAGLVMSMAKKTLEIYAAQGGSPAETLARVNDALAGDLGGKLFISLVYAVLSPAQRTITWARAGHNPVIRFNPMNGQMAEIKPPGMVLGMKAGQIFRQSLGEEVTRVEEGDLFLLYTDGIVETMNLQNEEFGNDRLNEVVRLHADDGPDRLIDMVMDRIRHFRGPRAQADDATMLALFVE